MGRADRAPETRGAPVEKWQSGGLISAHGMAARIPLRGLVSDLQKKYMDLLYKV